MSISHTSGDTWDFNVIFISVTAYECHNDHHLAKEIKKVIEGKAVEGESVKTMATLFSRNKMFRRRLKRKETNTG